MVQFVLRVVRVHTGGGAGTATTSAAAPMSLYAVLECWNGDVVEVVPALLWNVLRLLLLVCLFCLEGARALVPTLPKPVEWLKRTVLLLQLPILH